MEDVEKLLKGTVEELDRLLNAKNVLGDPIEREGSTVIPIVSYGFGFGAGGNVGAKSGTGAGTGGGGGIKPLGAIIFDKDGARVEAVHTEADTSPKGQRQSHGLMVNYLYDLSHVAANHEMFAAGSGIAASSRVKRLASAAQKILAPETTT